MDTFTGGLFTVAKFPVADEQGMVYDLSVVASDRGRPALRSMAAVLLKVVELEQEEEKAPPPQKPRQTTTSPGGTTDAPPVPSRTAVRDETVQPTLGATASSSSSKPTASQTRPTQGTRTEQERRSSTSRRPQKTTSERPPPPPLPPPKDLFAESSVNLEVFENMRTPAKILDLKELLYNPAEENVIFDLSNNFGLFEIDQVLKAYLRIHFFIVCSIRKKIICPDKINNPSCLKKILLCFT